MPQKEQEKGQIKRLDDEKVGGQATYVIQMGMPAEAPYGKVLFYVHQKHLLPVKVAFFDKQQKVLKELLMKKLKKIEGQLVPVEMVMKMYKKVRRPSCASTQLIAKQS